jgi:peptide methionine sulfoxide reductase MsrA
MAKDEVDDGLFYDFKVEISEDPDYITFRQLAQDAADRVNPTKTSERIKDLHASRLIRTVYGDKAYRADKLMDANAQEMSIRAHLVTTQIEVMIAKEALKSAIEAVSEHIRSEYHSRYLSKLRNNEMRDAYINTVLKTPLRRYSELRQLATMIELVIGDIDKNSFRLSDSLKCLELMANIKSQVV